MSRSGYVDDGDQWSLIRWRGAVRSAIRGRRGQKTLTDIREALDALPDGRLIAGELICEDGVCALGALAQRRQIDVSGVDPHAPDQVARAFDISEALACEIQYINDEAGVYRETPEDRYVRVRAWLDEHILSVESER